MMTVLLEAPSDADVHFIDRGFAPESRQVLPAPWCQASFLHAGQLVVERPVAREVLLPIVHRMVSVPFSASSRIDAVSGGIQFHYCKFDGEQNNVWTRIHCNLNSQSVSISEDFIVRVQGNFTISQIFHPFAPVIS